jgi:hypothetical protein
MAVLNACMMIFLLPYRAGSLSCESSKSSASIVRNLIATVVVSVDLSERRGSPSIISLRSSALPVVLEAPLF